MPSRLHISTSALTHTLQDFLGLQHPLGPGMAILVIEFVQEDARVTWPYLLRCLVLSATATSWIPNFVYRVSMGTSSCGLTPQIQWIMDLSFLWSLCKSGAVGAQVSLPCNRAERMQALNTFPQVKGDTCLEVSIGSSFLNFPQAVEHLVAIARADPPPALNKQANQLSFR